MLSNLKSKEMKRLLEECGALIVIVKDDNIFIDNIMEASVNRIIRYNHKLKGCMTEVEEFNKLIDNKKIKYNKISIGNVYFLRNNEIIKLPYLCRNEKIKEYIC